jgi:hypothetical protein
MLSMISLIEKPLSFVLAMLSLFRDGDVTLIEHEKRSRLCWGCDHIEITERGLHCRECHCPRWWLSDLRFKWRLHRYKCPIGRW